VQVTGEKVSILTDMAIRAENIDEAAAEQARQNAESRLAAKLTEDEAATVHAALVHATTQLNVKRRRR
jgi:F-type H+-transporting ATPase subunit epsilon